MSFTPKYQYRAFPDLNRPSYIYGAKTVPKSQKNDGPEPNMHYMRFLDHRTAHCYHNGIILERTQPMPTYSNSRLSTYEQCPLKYKFSYIDGIKREEEKGIEAFVGSRVHDTLEKCYNDLRYTKLNSFKELIAFYDRQWETNWTDTIFIAKKELSAKHYRELGRKFIETYYRRYAPFDQDLTIGTEIRVDFALDSDGQHKLTGYIDRLAKSQNDIYGIHDYKTSAHLPSQQNADTDRQLAIYQMAVQGKWPDAKNIRLIWHYLAFDKDIVSSRTAQQLQTLKDQTVELIKKIESTKQFRPAESHLCEWCEYPDLCPKRKHLYRVESMPVNQYLKEPGVVLVNKLAQLEDQVRTIQKEKIAPLEAEIELVEQALLKYAKKEGVEAVQGNDRLVRIKLVKKIKFPGKNDADRPELDQVIREIGKWDEVSQIDIYALSDIIEEGLWTKDMIKKVMKYGRIEESESISLSKLKDKEK